MAHPHPVSQHHRGEPLNGIEPVHPQDAHGYEIGLGLRPDTTKRITTEFTVQVSPDQARALFDILNPCQCEPIPTGYLTWAMSAAHCRRHRY